MKLRSKEGKEFYIRGWMKAVKYLSLNDVVLISESGMFYNFFLLSCTFKNVGESDKIRKKKGFGAHDFEIVYCSGLLSVKLDYLDKASDEEMKRFQMKVFKDILYTMDEVLKGWDKNAGIYY